MNQIFPALIGFLTSLTILFFIHNYSFLRAYVFRKTIISSLLFISSGFIFQVIYTNRALINQVAKSYRDLLSLPPITIMSTILAIFLGNSLLRKIADDKERREVAILFRNTIDMNLDCMKFIFVYLTSNDVDSLLKNNRIEDENLRFSNEITYNLLEAHRNRINTHFLQLKGDIYYETAFKKIGIYGENEIDSISLYTSQKQKLIGSLERVLISLNQIIFLLDKDNLPEIKDALEKQFIFETEIAIFKLIKTEILGFLCLLKLFQYSEKQRQNNYQEDFEKILNQLRSLNNLLIVTDGSDSFYNRDISMKDLSFLMNKFSQDFSQDNYTSFKNPFNFYYCLVKFSSANIQSIFKIHPKIHLATDTHLDDKCILIFGDSEEDVKRLVKEKLNHILKKEFICPQKKIEFESLSKQVTDYLELSANNISPYPKNI